MSRQRSVPLAAAAAAVVLALLLQCNMAVVAKQQAAVGDSKIKHFVVMMMENRAFDHFLGFLKRSNPDIDGLNGDEW